MLYISGPAFTKTFGRQNIPDVGITMGVKIYILVQMSRITLMCNGVVELIVGKTGILIDIDYIVLVIINGRNQVKCRA